MRENEASELCSDGVVICVQTIEFDNEKYILAREINFKNAAYFEFRSLDLRDPKSFFATEKNGEYSPVSSGLEKKLQKYADPLERKDGGIIIREAEESGESASDPELDERLSGELNSRKAEFIKAFTERYEQVFGKYFPEKYGETVLDNETREFVPKTHKRDQARNLDHTISEIIFDSSRPENCNGQYRTGNRKIAMCDEKLCRPEQNYISETLFHEIFHADTATYTTMDGKNWQANRVGVFTASKDGEKFVGTALNEGLTEYFASKLYGVKPNTYEANVALAKAMIGAFGEETMLKACYDGGEKLEQGFNKIFGEDKYAEFMHRADACYEFCNPSRTYIMSQPRDSLGSLLTTMINERVDDIIKEAPQNYNEQLDSLREASDKISKFVEADNFQQKRVGVAAYETRDRIAKLQKMLVPAKKNDSKLSSGRLADLFNSEHRHGANEFKLTILDDVMRQNWASNFYNYHFAFKNAEYLANESDLNGVMRGAQQRIDLVIEKGCTQDDVKQLGELRKVWEEALKNSLVNDASLLPSKAKSNIKTLIAKAKMFMAQKFAKPKDAQIENEVQATNPVQSGESLGVAANADPQRGVISMKDIEQIRDTFKEIIESERLTAKKEWEAAYAALEPDDPRRVWDISGDNFALNVRNNNGTPLEDILRDPPTSRNDALGKAMQLDEFVMEKEINRMVDKRLNGFAYTTLNGYNGDHRLLDSDMGKRLQRMDLASEKAILEKQQALLETKIDIAEWCERTYGKDAVIDKHIGELEQKYDDNKKALSAIGQRQKQLSTQSLEPRAQSYAQNTAFQNISASRVNELFQSVNRQMQQGINPVQRGRAL